MTVYTKVNTTETNPSNDEKERIAFLKAIHDTETRKEIIRLLREGGSLS